MYLGLDVGTSAVKAVVMNQAGVLEAQASHSLTIDRPRPLWSEQAPEDWWTATQAVVAALPEDLRARVQGVGLSGQMHGAVLLDRADRPLRSAILWNDGRSAAECAELETLCPQSRTITGNAAMPGFTAPKLLWIRRHEPDVANALFKVLLPKDYVRLRMTGDYATDVSDASGTLWLDVGRRDWSAEMLAACSLSRAQMPSLHEGCTPTGRLRDKVATAWGMQRVPVVAGGGDNAAGAIGCGVVREGDAFLSLGTSGVLFVANDAFSPAPDQGAHAFCHALPRRWHQMAVLLSAAASLAWIAQVIGARDPVSALAAARAGGEPFGGREIFLPYLSGERTPHNDPNATGVLFGLSQDSDSASLVLAVLEGVAFAFRDGLTVLEAAGGSIGQMKLIGGGARSALWARILASVLDRPLAYANDASYVGPAFGAARLAQIGVTGAKVEDVARSLPVERLVEPEPALTGRALEKYALFRALYPALKSSFGAASRSMVLGSRKVEAQ
jgi:xylulokinase